MALFVFSGVAFSVPTIFSGVAVSVFSSVLWGTRSTVAKTRPVGRVFARVLRVCHATPEKTETVTPEKTVVTENTTPEKTKNATPEKTKHLYCLKP